ncbi:MAG: hypothetical protein ACI8W3_003639 [Myxococcota bacterium]|jgi:hypothetical protein
MNNCLRSAARRSVFVFLIAFVFLGASPLALAAPVAEPASEMALSDEIPDAVEAKPVAREVELEWSQTPGVYESELLRRYGNPLYREARRKVDEGALRAAKRKDAEEMWNVLESFIGLLSDKDRMAKYELASQMGDGLLRLDEGTWAALRVGGEAYKLAGAIQEVRGDLLKEWRVAGQSDPGVKALLDAEARIPTVQTDSSSIRFLALIQAARDDDQNAPLDRNEFAAALMSEEPDAIRDVYRALRGDLKRTVKQQLTRLLEEVGREEVNFAGRNERVAVVTELLGVAASDFGIFPITAEPTPTPSLQ